MSTTDTAIGITTSTIFVSFDEKHDYTSQINAIADGMRKMFEAATVNCIHRTAASKKELTLTLKATLNTAATINNALRSIAVAEHDAAEKGLQEIELRNEEIDLDSDVVEEDTTEISDLCEHLEIEIEACDSMESALQDCDTAAETYFETYLD